MELRCSLKTAVLLCLLCCSRFTTAHRALGDAIPNGHDVPCPPGEAGCDNGVCLGVGHASCKGGSLPMNAFGAALKDALWLWTPELCRGDADGDGWTNGEELGDPCCTWKRGDAPSGRAQSHPGNARFQPPAGAAKCGGASAGVADAKESTFFAPGEPTGVVDLMIANLSVPSDRTTSYFMVPFSLPNADSIHIVGFEGLIKSRLLHHFILFSCASGTTLSPNIQGPSAFEMKSDCVDVLFGWLPGLPPVVTPRTAGFRSGRTLLLQAHYNNPSREKGVVDTSGVRIHFTTRPRAFNMGMLWTGGVVSLFVPDHVMPAGRAAFFDTRACFVSTASAVTVVASTAHAHKTGRRVWSELFRLSGDNATVERIAELGRNDAYDFESQQAVPLNNIQLRDGDLISTTCVYDSTARNSGTVGGHGTDDEMCLNWLTVYPSFNTECVSIRQVGPLASGTLFSGASGDVPPSAVNATDSRLLYAATTRKRGVMASPDEMLAAMRRVREKGASSVKAEFLAELLASRPGFLARMFGKHHSGRRLAQQQLQQPGSALFHPSLPEFAASATAQRDAAALPPACAALGRDAVVPTYTSLDRVLLFDWAGADASGLGNIWQYFTHILGVGVLTRRAAFSSRNLPGCAANSSAAPPSPPPPPPPCKMDPGRFFAGPEGLRWAWDDTAEAAVRASAEANGFVEHILSPTGPSPLGWKDAATGRVFPPTELLPLLSSPELVHIPWITVRLMPGDGIDPWSDLKEWPPFYHRLFKSFQDVSEASVRDAWDAAAPPLPPHACVAQLFGAPSRALQAPLLPLLRRLDATRAAGGRVAFVHARTYAVDAKMTAPEKMVVMEAAAVASRGDTVLPETCGAGGRGSRGWAAFNDEAAECGAPLACASLLRPKPPSCAQFGSEPDAARAAVATRGASCAAGAASGAPPPDLFPGSNGTFTSVLGCAAAAAGRGGSVFFATDLDALSRLALSTSPSVFVTAHGPIGHVGNAGGGGGSGSWERSAIDFYMYCPADVVVTWGVSSFPAAAATRCTSQPEVLFRLRGLPGQVDAVDTARTPPAGDTSLLRAAVKSILYTSRAVEREMATA